MKSTARQLIKLTRRLVHDEGIVGTSKLLVRKFARKLRHEKPPNTVEGNREQWTVYDWSKLGDEWTSSPEWKASMVTALLEPWIPIGSRVLEIGPGGGRWTEYLLQRSRHLTLVDLTPACIDVCKQRFGQDPKIAFFVNDGKDLSFMGPNSVDRIWSFDVFVHIQPADVDHYLSQIATILEPGGIAVIHHSKAGACRRSWFSDMTAEKMRTLCQKHGFVVLHQLDRIGDDATSIYQFPDEADPAIVTIFQRPNP